MDRRLEIDYLELLPLEYKKKVEELIKCVNNAPNCDVKNELLENFTDKFTAVPEIWKFWMKIYFNVTGYGTTTKWCYIGLQQQCKKAFPQNEDEWPKVKYNRWSNNYDTLAEELEAFENWLSLPHSQLSYVFDKYQEKCTRPVSKQLIEKYTTSCELYQEMKEADINDSQQYIKILKKTENEEFAVLSVLQRYCRFFVNDKKIKEKYQTKIEEFSQSLDEISEFWIDSIKFELQFNGKDAAMKMVEKALKSNMKDFCKFCDKLVYFANDYKLSDIATQVRNAKEIYLKETSFPNDYKNFIRSVIFKNPGVPQLPFGKLTNAYILTNLDYQHLHKLYQTCKWFYFKYRYNLVHKLSYNDDQNDEKSIEYVDDSITLSRPQLKTCSADNVKNLWLTNTLVISCPLKLILKRVVKVSLKILHLNGGSVHIDEFKMLTSSKTIEMFYMSAMIYGRHQRSIQLEDILKEVLTAKHIIISSCHTTFKTPIKLSKMKFLNKIEHFGLRFQMNKPKKFVKFLKNNLAPLATLELVVYSDSSENFHNVVEKKIKKWKPCNQKPIFKWL